ncbi:MAG TPA: D-alanyl-D-alanine carboxypeptidase [Actinomycetota bacterium]|nr:D-alanyl-D-alanine carboxypeptidase [Actinomycetota bacterium]
MRRLTWALVALLVLPAWVAIATRESAAPARLDLGRAPNQNLSGSSTSQDSITQPQPAASTVGTPRWKRKINRIASGRSIGISVRAGGDVIYERGAKVKRLPASNEKLLLSMALYANLGTDFRIMTEASSESLDGGIVDGDLYVLGTGDPTLAASKQYARNFPFRATKLNRLARRIRDAGVQEITGSVVGAISYFSRDWFAPGWKSYFPSRYIPLPSALTFNGNRVRGIHISDPELRAARSLTKKLRKIGVKVRGAPGAGTPPGGLARITKVRSVPLETLVGFMNRQSSNFFAEVLGKRLGVKRYGRPGTIAKAADAVKAWIENRNVRVTAYDGSGLSYSNRISARGMARSLVAAEREPWGTKLRKGLPRGGQGTLKDRLEGLYVRAKTGTLTNTSTLSGWVQLKKTKQWAAFSIMSSGMPKSTAARVEDRVVRILRRSAR